MGHLFCLEAETGKILWNKDLATEYSIRMPTWGLAAAPLIEGDLVILQIGGENARCLVALDKRSGRQKWAALDDEASYSAPIMVDQAGERVLVCWTAKRVAGLNPTTGSVYWSYRFPDKKGPVVATPVHQRDRLFLTVFYEGSLMLRLLQDQPAIEPIWRRMGPDEQNTDALHSLISTPLFLGDHVYGVDNYGQLRCLDAESGDRLWESTDAVPRARWANIFFTRQGDRVWMFNEKGELIIARLTPMGYEEISRAALIAPTTDQLNQRGGVCWSHPAFANRRVYARNDKELVCGNLAR
jgi:hypothetical protein